jgi:1-phosphofructokinase family hexose kinase
MNRVVLTVTLNPAIDQTIVVDPFNSRGGYSIAETFTAAGGKGVNVSRALQSLKTPTIATGWSGGASEKIFKKLLGAEKILYNFSKIDGEIRTNFLITDSTFDRKSRQIENGPRVSSAEQQRFLKKYSVLLKKSCFVCISGSLPLGVDGKFYAQLIELAKRRSLPMLFDSSADAFKKGVKAKPTMIKPNMEEAQEFLGVKLNSMLKILSAVKSFHAQEIDVVLLTMGEKGAVCSNGRDIVYVSTVAREIKTDVGCGDAFVGGFLAGYIRRCPFVESVRMAAAAAAASAAQYAPGFVEYRRFTKMLSAVKLKSL